METLSARLVGRFELLGTQTAQMTVAAGSIVEGIDVSGDVGDRQVSAICRSGTDDAYASIAKATRTLQQSRSRSRSAQDGNQPPTKTPVGGGRSGLSIRKR